MTRQAVRERTWIGTLQTAGLTLVMAGLALAAAWSILGPWSIALAAVLAVMAYRALSASSFPARMANARRLGEYEAPGLHDLVEWLARRAGLPTAPRLYLSGMAGPNAAALGSREDSAIFVTPSLVRGLSERELAAVLAHEVSHIRNNDLGLYRLTEILRWVAVMTSRVGWILLAFSLPLTLAGALTIPAGTLLLLLAAPLGAQLLQLAIMRSREFAADLGAAELTGDPMSLASALGRIEQSNRWLLRVLLPFPVGRENGLLRSHPATPERIRRLRELAWSSASPAGVGGGYRSRLAW